MPFLRRLGPHCRRWRVYTSGLFNDRIEVETVNWSSLDDRPQPLQRGR